MAGFLYFVPVAMPIASREVLERFALEYAFDNPVARGVNASGPGGQSGATVVDKSFTGTHGFDPGRQVWTPLGKEGAYVGYEVDDPPHPDELRRGPFIHGQKVSLGDGNLWEIPVARKVDEIDGLPITTCNLPRTLELSDGQWVPGAVLPDYESLWILACEVWDYFVNVADGDTEAEFRNEIEAAVKSLSANYRIGPVECSLLKLFHTDGKQVQAILEALIDFAGCVALAEKKNLAGT